ncbi:Putative oxidoreductase GLYR1 homolog [Eumeta japonica]|uniref:Oxidoreductase GLYR1 homolog n=1 Tax=Eumeta variegata TaxID=151549 RepID=A0A4C1WAE0_EUMVA|nr:Putative oxidoreductase GLYR1 homolog [Eumeta japonica]
MTSTGTICNLTLRGEIAACYRPKRDVYVESEMRWRLSGLTRPSRRSVAWSVVDAARVYRGVAVHARPLLILRESRRCKEFEKIGATVAVTPCDVVEEADITFSCVSDPHAAKEMVFGNCGVLHCPSLEQKGYVEMTSIDADTSHDIVEAISGKGGRYLEAQHPTAALLGRTRNSFRSIDLAVNSIPVSVMILVLILVFNFGSATSHDLKSDETEIQGSKTQAEEGTLIILAAGERTLFDDCQSCFKAMSKNSFYLGDIGNASKMNSVLQVVGGVSLAALAEGLALADRAGLNQADLLDVLALTPLASPHLILKGRAMIESSYTTTHQPLSHMQKDLKLALGLGDALEQSLPLTATTNEIFKHAKRLGYANHDVSAVYIRARF